MTRYSTEKVKITLQNSIHRDKMKQVDPKEYSEVKKMAYQSSDDCIACGACAAGCPVGAISEGDGKYVIDADTCIDCGACAGTCPVGAPAQA